MIMETEAHLYDFSRYLRKRQSETNLITISILPIISTISIHTYRLFSLSRLTNKVKNPRHKRKWILEQSRKDSDLCDVSCGRYLKKCCTQMYRAFYGDVIFVSLWGERNKYGGRKLKKQHIVSSFAIYRVHPKYYVLPNWLKTSAFSRIVSRVQIAFSLRAHAFEISSVLTFHDVFFFMYITNKRYHDFCCNLV